MQEVAQNKIKVAQNTRSRQKVAEQLVKRPRTGTQYWPVPHMALIGCLKFES